MRAAALASFVLAMLMVGTCSAASAWIQPVCSGCCTYTAAVGQPLSISLHAARISGSSALVSIFPAEDPGIPIGSVLRSVASDSSRTLSTFVFTPLALHQNMSLTFHIQSLHDGATSSVCIAVTTLAPQPFYSADSLNSSALLSAAVNCPVALTVAVEDRFYPCSIRVSRMQTLSPTGALSTTIPNHVLDTLVTSNRHSVTLKFVPAFGSEASVFTACFIGGDSVGIRQLAEVCAVWTVSKCQ
jgi:hypothetical protein